MEGETIKTIKAPKYNDSFFVESADRKFCVIVEGYGLFIAKDALASWSPVFERMFFGDFSEAGKDSVELKDKKVDDILTVFHYLFPIRPYTAISLGNVQMLMEFADEYDCKKMTFECARFLDVESQRIEIHNGKVLQILPIASKFLLFDVIIRCIPYACAISTKEFETIERKLHSNIVVAVKEAKFARMQTLVHRYKKKGWGKKPCTVCEVPTCHMCSKCNLGFCERCLRISMCSAFHDTDCDDEEAFSFDDGSFCCLGGFRFNEAKLMEMKN